MARSLAVKHAECKNGEMVVSTDPGCDGEQDLGAAPSGSTIYGTDTVSD